MSTHGRRGAKSYHITGAVMITLFCTTLTASGAGPIDPNATDQTRRLFSSLKRTQGNGLLFGQQLYSWKGQTWNDPFDDLKRSDVKKGVGSNPAILGLNFDRDSEKLTPHARNAHARGSIVTVHWPMDNPVTNGTSGDKNNDTVRKILPGRSHHKQLRTMLDTFADWANSLTDPQGALIPIIFRPYHENTGNNFWWGTKEATGSQYRRLWQFTVSYLRDTKNVHNVLYAYAPRRPFDTGGYEADRYPGDAFVDIVAFDRYDNGRLSDHYGLISDATLVVNFAREHGKIPAIAELGFRRSFRDVPTWYSDILQLIKNDRNLRELAYLMTWTNFSRDDYRVPLPGQIGFESFQAFAQDDFTIFENTWSQRPEFGERISWDGAGETSAWHDHHNWNFGSMPVASEQVVIGDDRKAHFNQDSGDQTVGSVIIGSLDDKGVLLLSGDDTLTVAAETAYSTEYPGQVRLQSGAIMHWADATLDVSDTQQGKSDLIIGTGGDVGYHISESANLWVEDDLRIASPPDMPLDAESSLGSSVFEITGSKVTVEVGAFWQGVQGDLRLVADANGLSPIVVRDEVTLAGETFLDLTAISEEIKRLTLIRQAGIAPIVGTFSNADEGAMFHTASGHAYRLSYFGGTGNDLVLRIVPEPSTLAIVNPGLMFLLHVGTRRRKGSGFGV